MNKCRMCGRRAEHPRYPYTCNSKCLKKWNLMWHYAQRQISEGWMTEEEFVEFRENKARRVKTKLKVLSPPKEVKPYVPSLTAHDPLERMDAALAKKMGGQFRS